jgi:hypothetical protein
MAAVKTPLQVYNGKIENLWLHVQELTRCMKNTGLYKEFTVRTQENTWPPDIPEEQWTDDHPLRWQTANFIENFNIISITALLQEKERIDDTLELLEELPTTREDDGASELASKQHRTWIAELLYASWLPTVVSEMTAFDEETLGDGILLFYVFMRENIGFTNEALIMQQNNNWQKINLPLRISTLIFSKLLLMCAPTFIK